MARTVKHLSLHRIAGTELRVVSDAEAGVLPVIQVEAAVIRGYVGASRHEWPHRWVTLFILQDLQPLVRQLAFTPSLPQIEGGSEGGGLAVEQRPVLNIYDLANPDGCHVFINQHVMTREGYWDDLQAIRGLLAHEHAHPLAENETTRASRELGNLRIKKSGNYPMPGLPNSLLTSLAERLCVRAPREVFANEQAIRSGFGDALLHLNRRNVTNAGRSMAGRKTLHRRLQAQVAQGTLTPAAAAVLLFTGDLDSHLDLALEVAPFYRAGRENDAKELESVLETEVFPHLDPQVARTYTALREQYIALTPNLSRPGLTAWSEGVLSVLAKALAEKGLELQYCLRRTGKRDV